MKVLLGTDTLMEQRFEVAEVPMPKVAVVVDGVIIDQRRGIAASQIKGLKVNVVAQESFGMQSPEDSRYVIKSCTYTLTEKGRAVKRSPNLTQIIPLVKEGQQLLIEVGEVRRKHSCVASSELVRLSSFNKYINLSITK